MFEEFEDSQSSFYRRSRELGELFAALAKAQGAFEAAEKAGKNNFGKYATLESVFEATKTGRQENGLAVVQLPGNIGDAVAVTTILGHSSGQWIESVFAVRPVKFDAQGAGSVVTYLRRYALMSILGIAPEDDDGGAAVAGARSPAQYVAPPRPAAREGATTSSANGRSPLPAPQSKLLTPPHDPETGEIAPHTIPLEVTDRGPDFVRWGGLLIAGVKTASTFAEIKDWEKLNADAMRMATGTKALKSVSANFERIYSQFESDVVGEDDAKTILN
jgi:hypothetical protein